MSNDLISRSALKKKSTKMYGFGNNKYISERAVDEAPAVDAVPVVHGRWIPIEEELWNLDFPVVVDWKCSACNAMGNEDFNYCPNCGAKMDGEKDG